MVKRSIDDADAAYGLSAKRTRLDAEYVPPVTRSQTSPLGQLTAIAAATDRRAATMEIEKAIDVIGPTLPLQDPRRVDALIERIREATPADQSRALRLMGDHASALSPDHQRELADAALHLVGSARTRDQLLANMPEPGPVAGRVHDANAIDAAVFLKQRLRAEDIDADLKTHIDDQLREFSRRPHIRTLLREVDRNVRNGFGDHDRMHVRSGDIRREIEGIRNLAADRAIPQLKALMDRTMAEQPGDPDRMIQAAQAVPIVHATVQREQERNQPDRSRSRQASIGR